MSQRVTLAQVVSKRDVKHNLNTVKNVLRVARTDKSNWVVFPELYLSGTYNGENFEQAEVERAYTEILGLCKDMEAIVLLGTGWRENGKTYNQIRIIDHHGKEAGVYAKTCLTYDDARAFSPGPLKMIHNVGGITFGTLVCNDLWVTPGFTDGPDPRLTLQQARAGCQAIFHAVGSGSEQRYRAYHESNLMLRAAEAKCPIITVNAFHSPIVNSSSGIVGTDFQFLNKLPDNREAIETVEFVPAVRNEG